MNTDEIKAMKFLRGYTRKEFNKAVKEYERFYDRARRCEINDLRMSLLKQDGIEPESDLLDKALLQGFSYKDLTEASYSLTTFALWKETTHEEDCLRKDTLQVILNSLNDSKDLCDKLGEAVLYSRLDYSARLVVKELEKFK